MIPSHPSTPLRCWAEIDLAALERNLRLIRASLPPHIRYVAVVKADAYGHGLQQVAGRLMHAGADLFAVANITEAAQLRELGPGWPILLLSPLLPDEDRFAAEYDVERKFRETRLYQTAPISTNLILSYIAEHVLGLPRSY